MKIPFFYCDIPNFGDALNPIIFSKLAKIKIRFAPVDFAMIMGIGSLGDMLLMDTKDHIFKENPIWLFSTGIGFEEGKFFHNPNIILPEKLRRNVKCYALRGKLTEARISKMLGHSTGAVLGDGGLLVSYLIDSDKIEKKYELGIVPHYADRDSKVFSKITGRIPNSKILDATLSVDKFLHDMCECKAVISTAMHPLIACDALRIPNQWVRISEETTSRYKFYDYYSVFNKQKEPLDLSNYEFCEADLNNLVKNYDISDEEVFKVQRELLCALQSLCIDLNKIKYKLLFMSFIKLILRPVVCLFPIKKIRKKFKLFLKY